MPQPHRQRAMEEKVIYCFSILHAQLTNVGTKCFVGSSQLLQVISINLLVSHQPDKGLDFEGDLRIPDKLVGKTGGDSKYWDKARKKDLTVKNLEGDKDQDLLSGTEGDMCR